MNHRNALLTLGLSLCMAACVPRATVLQPAPRAHAPRATFVPSPADPGRRDKLANLSAELDAHFQAKVAESRGAAAAIGIVLGGELACARSFGVRDIDSGAAVDTDTVFRIASLSKSFTAAAVMRLRDDGRLLLDEPVVTYLPELASFVGPTGDAPRFTVRQLLTMSAGLPYDDMWGPVMSGMSEQELTAFVQAGVALAYPPGEQYLYSNLG